MAIGMEYGTGYDLAVMSIYISVVFTHGNTSSGLTLIIGCSFFPSALSDLTMYETLSCLGTFHLMSGRLSLTI